MTRSIEAVALAYFDAVAKKELDRVEALVAPDVEFVGPAMTIQGVRDLIAAFRRIGAIHVRTHVKRVFSDGNEVCHRDEPAPEVVRAYIRSWEDHDVESLVALLHDDVVFAMPPHATWFHGAADVERFLRGPLFSPRWSAARFRVVPTRANGQLALAFYRSADGGYERSSLQLLRFAQGRARDVVIFVGADYLHGFDVPIRPN